MLHSLIFTTCAEPSDDGDLWEAYIHGKLVRANSLAALLRDELWVLAPVGDKAPTSVHLERAA